VGFPSRFPVGTHYVVEGEPRKKYSGELPHTWNCVLYALARISALGLTHSTVLALIQTWRPAHGPGSTFGGTTAMSNNATKAETAITELVVAFPAAFTLDPTLVRPVKLGIKDDIYAQSAISRRRIKAALRSYCNSVHYLRASTEGAMRIDLTGEPAGTVTATEGRHATERLAVLAKVAAKRAGKVASATAAPKASDISKRTLPAEPATPGQKRLSLGDLKRAAAARKAMR
jgi:sRNA-binding protein